MRIVSNTGPIIGLAKIAKLDLLKDISEEKRVYEDMRVRR